MMRFLKILVFLVLAYLSILIVHSAIYCCINITNLKTEQIFNAGEMLFWWIIGLVFFVKVFRQTNRYQALSYILAVVFPLFGLSDNFEIQSGVVEAMVVACLESIVYSCVCNIISLLHLE